MKSTNKLFTEAAIGVIRSEIEGASGNEVFFLGNTDEGRIVIKVIPLARGNAEAVPAITQLARPGDVVIHNHPSGPLDPSTADLSIASTIGRAGVGFYIVNNAVTQVYEVVSAFEHEQLKPLDIEKLCAILMPGGPIAGKLKKYEHREQQIEMLRTVARGFNENGIIPIEAGTGTGKTFAYMIPAIFWAVDNKERVVVSTNTINLQEQLIKKDIPTLLSALNLECKAVLVKGRGNYVCRRKLAMLENEFDLLTTPDEREMLLTIREWAKKSRDGTRSDLNFIPKAEIWEKVNSESDTCVHARCDYFSNCFVNRARREAASANLLIVNHHLLFADLSVRSAADNYAEMAVLPGYRRIILDEAHNVEDSATSYFGARVTRIGLLRLLRRVHYRRKGGDEGGLITVLKGKLLRADGIGDEVDEIILDIQNDIIPMKSELDYRVGEAFDAIHEFTASQSEWSNGEVKLRVEPDIEHNLHWKENCLPPVNNLLSDLRAFMSRVGSIVKRLEQISRKMENETAFIDERIELKAVCNRLDLTVGNIEKALFDDSEDRIRWIEANLRSRWNVVRLYSVPLEVGKVLAEQVYSKFPTVILTSATLTVEGRFEFVAGRIGLDAADGDRIDYLALPSPFDFGSQAILGIPTDIPVVNDQGYRESLIQSIFKCLTISQGRAFILFTSFSMLDTVYSKLAPELEKLMGINTLKQGDDNRTTLLERFRRDTTSVLFATLSFWEGVDVEGESLECIVLVKLPFKVPDDPVIQARAENIERRGGNAFTEYSVPLAAIKLKQGFGRLIRNRTDHGAVLILDKRIVEKFYGRTFLNSLPPCRIVRGTSDTVFEEFQEFFNAFRGSRHAPDRTT